MLQKPLKAVAKVKAYKKTVEAIEKDIASQGPLVAEDDKMITDYMAKKNITGAKKTPWGAYVAITTPGPAII